MVNIGLTVVTKLTQLQTIKNCQFPFLLKKHFLTFKVFVLDGQAISHCLDMTLQASVLQYKTEYNEYILGKGASNPAISYPEHDRLKKIKDATKKVLNVHFYSVLLLNILTLMVKSYITTFFHSKTTKKKPGKKWNGTFITKIVLNFLERITQLKLQMM